MQGRAALIFVFIERLANTFRRFGKPKCSNVSTVKRGDLLIDGIFEVGRGKWWPRHTAELLVDDLGRLKLKDTDVVNAERRPAIAIRPAR